MSGAWKFGLSRFDTIPPYLDLFPNLISFWEDIKGFKNIKDNDDDYNNKDDNNKNNTYKKGDNKAYKYDKDSSALGLDSDL